jgi:hypothetical protein
MNSARMMRSGRRRKATRQGIESSNVSSTARRPTRARFVTGRDPARHFRQKHGADGDADDPDRQLIEPIGIVERRKRASSEETRDDGIGKQCDLRAGRADRRRPERVEEAFDVLIPFRPAEYRHHTVAQRVATDQKRLENAGDEHAPRGGVAWRRKKYRHRECGHHR